MKPQKQWQRFTDTVEDSEGGEHERARRGEGGWNTVSQPPPGYRGCLLHHEKGCWLETVNNPKGQMGSLRVGWYRLEEFREAGHILWRSSLSTMMPDHEKV